MGAALNALPAEAPLPPDLQAAIDRLEQTYRVSDQIVRGARLISRGATSTVTLRLQPEELGEVTIRLVSSDGTLSGDITVQNRAVREVVHQHLGTLREALTAQNLQVDQLQVSVDSQGQAQQDRQAFQQLMDQRTGSGRGGSQEPGTPGQEQQEQPAAGTPLRNPNGQLDFTA